MGDFVDSPMSSEFIRTGTPESGPGEFDGCKEGPFGEFPRTPSPNGVKERVLDGRIDKPSGEADQF